MADSDDWELLPPPSGPCLAYSFSPLTSSDSRVIYDLSTGEWSHRSIPWLCSSNTCRAAHFGWFLLQDSSSLSDLSLYNPSAHQQLYLPAPPSPYTINQDYVCRFFPSLSNDHHYVVAIHRTEGFFFYCRPTDSTWTRHEFTDALPHVCDAVVYDYKIYAISYKALAVIEFSNGNVSAIPTVTYFPCSVRRPVVRHRYKVVIFLVESLGHFYRIEMYHDMPTDTFSPIHSPCALVVYRLVLPAHEWQATTSIGNRVFALGHHFCNSYASSSVKDGLINFGAPDGRFLSFNVKSGSLTTRHLDYSKLLPCEESMHTMDSAKPPPFWLLLEDDVRVDRSRIIGKLKEHPVYDPLKHLPTSSSRALHKRVRLGTMKGASSPSTPWLLLRRRFGSRFALLDPYSNKVYKLQIPQLSKAHICYSKDGWLLAYSMFLFFFNPVTGERINFPNKDMVEAQQLVLAEGGISLSSPPTSADCRIFTIMPYGDHHEGGQIRTFRLSDSSFTRLEYSNNLPIELSYTSPVYLKGLFYCLGREGNLGVYDPVANSWTVMNPSIPFGTTLWTEPFLLESQSELLSVFLDEFGILIGVCTLDFDSGQWRKLAHLGDRTLFVSREASFIVPAARPEMGNKVYTPKFCGEYGSQLVSYEVGVDAGCRKGLTKAEYLLHIWIQPKGAASFELGMDQVTGQATPSIIEHQIRKKQKSKAPL